MGLVNKNFVENVTELRHDSIYVKDDSPRGCLADQFYLAPVFHKVA